jgi:hypothetical protein
MDRKTKICIWIILIGLTNFLAYTMIYMFLDGEAVNGWVTEQDGQRMYFLASPGQAGQGKQVSYGEYLYSGVHSISVWITVGAVMLAMLTLAKDRIVSSMSSTILHGRTFITVLATMIAFAVVIITIWFILQFSNHLLHPLIPVEPSNSRTVAPQ